MIIDLVYDGPPYRQPLGCAGCQGSVSSFGPTPLAGPAPINSGLLTLGALAVIAVGLTAWSFMRSDEMLNGRKRRRR